MKLRKHLTARKLDPSTLDVSKVKCGLLIHSTACVPMWDDNEYSNFVDLIQTESCAVVIAICAIQNRFAGLAGFEGIALLVLVDGKVGWIDSKQLQYFQ